MDILDDSCFIDDFGGAEAAASAGEKQSKKSPADKLFQLVQDRCELWRCGDESYYTIDNRTFAIESDTAKEYLVNLYFDELGTVPTEAAVRNVLLLMAAKSKDQQHKVYNRVARVGNKIIVDLGCKDWKAVEITSTGWQVLPTHPVRFVRGQNFGQLPEPIQGGDCNHLRKFLNTGSEGFILVLAFLFDCLNPDSDYFCCVLGGEQGTGKSTILSILRYLIDPVSRGFSERCTAPKNERDLAIEAADSYVMTYDNISKIQPWLSDALCKLSTGGGLKTRKLYSNNASQIFSYKRPVVLNGIEDFVTRGDLADRSLLIPLEWIPDDQKIESDVFWHEFHKIHGSILGGLFSAVAYGLSSQTEYKKKPRMAASYKWVGRCLEGLGIDSETWAATFAISEERSTEIAVESSYVAIELEKLAHSLCKEGESTWIPTSLLSKELTSQGIHSLNTSKRLANAIRRVAPLLRKRGVDVEQKRKENGRGWQITIAN